MGNSHIFGPEASFVRLFYFLNFLLVIKKNEIVKTKSKIVYRNYSVYEIKMN